MLESGHTPRVAVHTLGCKLNYAESSTIAKQFSDRGYDVVPFGGPAEIVVLNTCSVTENAERECRQIVRRVLRKSPEAFVAVTGCYAQLRPAEIARIDGVDAVLGSTEKFELFDQLSTFQKRERPLVLATDVAQAVSFHTAATSEVDARTRAFLKVQDGCDYTCSYCTIPEARGASRSGSIESVVEEARRLSAEGFREIVLSGVNVGDFGSQNGETFLQLARALDSDSEVTARLRVSSIEPNLLSPEIIELMAGSGKWCPHFHLPLQSGSPNVLRLMQRRYKRDLYTARVELIRQALPQAAIGADVIVGFPGETDTEFLETVAYLTELPVSYLHVFTFSERPGTRAARMSGTVPHQVRRERNHILRELSQTKTDGFYDAQLGSECIALLENRREAGRVFGYTENYVRVSIDEAEAGDGELLRVRLDKRAEGVVLASALEVVSRRPHSELLPILC
jgi:threonylcarbamoyladenosine tRNA methylthiotransferase MtaB